ncbi:MULTISPECIES: DddA-like double-stranded DNA deaminase toxin [Prauserella salsuginis group]|uniref:DddA-like double-stranded DNA deaminase toxin n=1 Tax=Prauserella salsuginis TaxID=387889 RepID=A0ABW6G025_9PSEU|nr:MULTISPECIES: DddA-like double-stranded DNA deaminase toxin [Prauserella salsuginis group]MCR3721167.1 SCP1.201-like deaminase [Prauserella flava]MCR3734752.1 SCP1.201-like deaminase [Prauserella salsuginis]
MASLSDVIARLHGALDRLPTGTVKKTRAHISDTVAPAFAELTRGTANHDLITARTALQTVARSLERVEKLLGSASAHAAEWLSEHGEQAERSSPGTYASPPVRAGDVTSRVSTYRAKLENPWPYGKPLRGWRLTRHGEDVGLSSGARLESGQTDPAYTAAVERATALGLARGGFVPDIARHIEIKEAATMRAGETRTIVIGKDPCGIDPVTNVSCHRFLKHFLPPNATLIVHGPAGSPYRYEGKPAS